MAKIRNGFVSNSSSSSFMIYGGSLNLDGDLSKIIEKLLEGKSETEKADILDCVYEDKEHKDVNAYELREYLYDVAPKEFNIESAGYDGEYVYIGKDPSSQPDNQTHGDWKKEIQDKLKNVLGDGIGGFGWHEDCSYDS